MNLFNIEAGPWGGLILILVLVGVVAALWFTTWIVSGVALAIVIALVALVLYFGGRRISRRLVHGKRS